MKRNPFQFSIRNEERKRKFKSKVTKEKNGEHKVNSNSISFPAGKNSCCKEKRK